MRKCDLKTGMRVNVRGPYPIAIIQIIDEEIFGILPDERYHEISHYFNDDLTNTDFGDLDIVEVFDIPENKTNLLNFLEKGILLWNEKENKIKELTVKQISELLGYEVKIVK